MKNVLLMLLFGVMVLGAKLATADTRTDSLGLTAGQQVDDLDSIWLFPQDASKFGNVADFRLGFISNDSDNSSIYSEPNLDNAWGGVIMKEWEDIGYFGLYVNRPFQQDNANGDSYLGWNPQASNNNGILNGSSTWGDLFSSYSNLAQYNHSENGHIYAPYSTYGFVDHFDGVSTPQNKFDLFWAKDYSDVSLGLHINYASSDAAGQDTGSNSDDAYTHLSQTSNDGVDVLGLDLGLSVKNLGPFASGDLGVGYSLGSLNYTYEETNSVTPGSLHDDTTAKDNNISELRVNLLLKSAISDNTTGRIYANARLDSFGINETALHDYDDAGNYTAEAGENVVDDQTYSDTNFNIGIACNHKLEDGKALVIAGVGFIFDDVKWGQTVMENAAGSSVANQLLGGGNFWDGDNSGGSAEEVSVTVPANVAVEAPVLFSWLKGRVGLSYNLWQAFNYKTVTPYAINGAGTAWTETATESNTFDPFDYVDLTMGLSAQINNFTLDLQVDPYAFEQMLGASNPGGGIFWPGVDPNENPTMFVQADMKYAF